MLQARNVPVWALVGLGFLCLLILKHTATVSLSLSQYSAELFTSYTPASGAAKENAQVIFNSTLGFEKIFAIGLPERSDKRDALALTSSLTGFKIDWVDGVKGESVPDKALPFGVDRSVLWENNVGSWRGHINAVRKIVEGGYATALIMEDDMDWDVRLKKQLVQFAQGARYIQLSQHQISPYGNDWDLLWLGHCGEVFPETLDEYKGMSSTDSSIAAMSRKYVINPDVTVPPPEETRGFQNHTAHPYTRWVHISGGPICSFAYALSQKGARKVLFDLSVDHLVGPFDNALAGLCRWGRDEQRMGMKCISVTPPLFSHHKAKGHISKDSDIQSYGSVKEEVRGVGWTENIVWSARANAHNMLISRKMESQFRD